MFSLLIDNRERAVLPFLDMEMKGYNYSHHQLNTGDFLIVKSSENDKNNFNIIACIERKTYADLASSFRDGRYKSEIYKMVQMRKETGCKLFLFLEGVAFPSPSRSFQRIPYSCILGAINKLMIRNNIFVIQVENERHTARKLNELLTTYNLVEIENIILQKGIKEGGKNTEENIEKENIKEENIEEKNTEEENIEEKNTEEENIEKNTEKNTDKNTEEEKKNTPSIIAEGKTIKSLTKRIIKTNEELILKSWSNLRGISIVLGRILMNKFSIKHFMLNTTIEEIKELKTAFGKKINKDAMDSLIKVKNGNFPLCAKMLSATGGLSLDYASKILKIKSLYEICQNTENIAFLSNIIINNKKIGIKKSENINKLLLGHI
jgi:ERCC4-type nuclease